MGGKLGGRQPSRQEGTQIEADRQIETGRQAGRQI